MKRKLLKRHDIDLAPTDALKPKANLPHGETFGGLRSANLIRVYCDCTIGLDHPFRA